MPSWPLDRRWRGRYQYRVNPQKPQRVEHLSRPPVARVSELCAANRAHGARRGFTPACAVTSDRRPASMEAVVALKDNLLAFANERLPPVDPVVVLSTVLIVMGVYLVMFVAAARSPPGARRALQDEPLRALSRTWRAQPREVRLAQEPPRPTIIAGLPAYASVKRVIFVRHGESTWNEIFNRGFNFRFPFACSRDSCPSSCSSSPRTPTCRFTPVRSRLRSGQGTPTIPPRDDVPDRRVVRSPPGGRRPRSAARGEATSRKRRVKRARRRHHRPRLLGPPRTDRRENLHPLRPPGDGA